MRLHSGSGAMAGGEGMQFAHPTTQHRHAELVSASIVPLTPTLECHSGSAVCSFDPSAQIEGWTLKKVQCDGGLRMAR